MQSAAVYVPQYGISEYVLSTALLPPSVAGCPFQGALPMVFVNAVATLVSNKSAQAGSVVTTGGVTGGGVATQQFYKFLGNLYLDLLSKHP